VKASIADMTLEQRLEVAALIAHLNRSADSEFEGELERRMTAMDQGHKIASEQLEKAHDILQREGK
jgi:hypothetical protein